METKKAARTRLTFDGAFVQRGEAADHAYILVPIDSPMRRVQGDAPDPVKEEGRDNYLFSVDRYCKYFYEPGVDHFSSDASFTGQVCVEFQSYDYHVGKTLKHWEGYKVVAARVVTSHQFRVTWADYAGGEDHD